MAKVNTGRMEMETDVIRASGSAMKAAGTESAKSAEQIIQRINDSEHSIGTGSAAESFHFQYNWPATSVKRGTTAAAQTLTDLGTSMVDAATEYEQVDEQYRARLNQVRRA